VPKFDVEARLMKKCDLCYSRTVQGFKTWCAQVCPTQAIWYGDFEEFAALRRGRAVNLTGFGGQEVQTRVYHVLPEETPRLDVIALLTQAETELGREAPREEAWVL
jgi:Fe-S-cluster-containing dehydrogenase component